MQDQPDLRVTLERALAEGQRLREEVQQLKAILANHSIPFQEVDSKAPQPPPDCAFPRRQMSRNLERYLIMQQR